MTDLPRVDVAPRIETDAIEPAIALRIVADAARAAAAGDALPTRLRALLVGLRTLGFGRVLLETRDPAHERPWLLAEGFGERELPTLGASLPSARVWRRWLRLLERRRPQLGLGAGFWLDLRDAWAREEFGHALGGDAPVALYVVPVLEAGRGCCATLLLEGPRADAPAELVVQAVELLAGQIAHAIVREELSDLAAQRAERLRRLYDAGGALARSLDAQEVVRELARQAVRLVPHDGLVVAHPDLERGVVRTALRQVHGLLRPRADQPLGQGPIGEVARTGNVVRIDDYDSVREPLAAADDLVGDAGAARSVLAVPMRVGPQLVGVLAVHAVAARAFDGESEELLRTLAAQAGTALANARLFAESEAQRRQGEALVAVARAVGASLRLGEVLRLVLRHTVGLLRAEGACVALRRDEWLQVKAGVGCVELLAGVYLPVDGTLLGRAVREGSPLVCNDVGRSAAMYAAPDGVAHIEKTIAVPLRTAEGIIGVISVVNRPDDFGPDDARVLERLAEHVAIAIVNARLFEEVAAGTREWQVSFDAIAAGLAVLDEDGRVVRCNARAAELVGAPGPKALHGAILDVRLAGPDAPEPPRPVLVRGPDAESASDEPAEPGVEPRLSGLVARALRTGAPARGLVRASERGRAFDVVASPHPSGGAVVTFDDVTEQLAMAERHRLVVETTADAIVVSDAAGVITFANPAARALFGRGDALVGMRSPELVRVVDVPRLAAQPTRTTSDAPGFDAAASRSEVAITRPDGTERLVEVSTARLSALGEAGSLVASLRDVTEERRALAATRTADERYVRLVESASDAIFTLDAAGCFTSLNRAMELATGRGREAILGLHCSAVVDPRDREGAVEIVEATLRGERVRRELRYRDRMGRPRVASVTTTPVFDGDTVDGALGVVRDVTGERRLAEQLLQREKMAAMGQLVSSVAHELNNPLTGVLAFGELLLAEPALHGTEPPAVELRELAETIQREARRAARTVGKLLTFARQQPPQREGTDVNRVLLDALDLRRYALRAQRIDIEVALDYELPLTWADGHRLQQVFLNLITNAEQAMAMAPAPVERRLRVCTRLERGRLQVTVADTGPGLTPEARARLFEPFFTTKPAGEGTGLGLAVSTGIVREHGGQLTVRSAPGEGATFIVELPCVTPPNDPEPV
jgi:PAS domain S-box-containing protein